jgi:prepilin-type N-terminal cleavage/methylation domain-containing protein
MKQKGFTPSLKNGIVPKYGRRPMPFSSVGFTLVELVVTISIISLIYTVLLGSRNRYSDQLILKNEAYNLSLALRQAQLYSLGVVSSGNTQYFNTSYGVSFGICRRDRGHVYSFVDQNLNGVYDDATEPVVDYQFPSSVRINSVNGTKADGAYEAGATNCGGGAPGTGIKYVDITFTRPSPVASIKYFKTVAPNDPTPVPHISYAPVCIKLENQSAGLTAAVKVDTSGQITLKSTCP